MSRYSNRNAEQWARGLLAAPDWVILDTETTGLTDAEIVEIGVLDPNGVVLLETLVKPLFPIPPAAIAIHGITNEKVASAPSLNSLLPRLECLLHNKRVLVYNAEYDKGVLSDCLERRWCAADQAFEEYQRHRARVSEWIDAIHWEDVLEPYSAWVGEWAGGQRYRRQSLPGGNHSAIGDCRATLEVIRLLARSGTERSEFRRSWRVQ